MDNFFDSSWIYYFFKMKPTTLLFISSIFLIILKSFKIFNINVWVIVIFVIFTFFVYYFRTHQENKRAKIPKPVYLVDNLSKN